MACIYSNPKFSKHVGYPGFQVSGFLDLYTSFFQISGAKYKGRSRFGYPEEVVRQHSNFFGVNLYIPIVLCKKRHHVSIQV